MLNLFQHPTGQAACMLFYLAREIPKQVRDDGEIIPISFIAIFPPFTDGFAAFPKYR